MYNYTIKVSQLNDNKYEYVGDMFIESDVTMEHLQNDFDTCMDFFDNVMDLLKKEQNIKMVEPGEYWLKNEVSYEGIIVEQNDDIFTLKVELMES